jgi:hypothetical protein
MPLGAWLPETVAPESGSVHGAPPTDQVPAVATAEQLTRAALDALGRARARPGRHRESAFDLLAADALVTYACEAAVEGEDIEDGLSRILRTVSAR